MIKKEVTEFVRLLDNISLKFRPIVMEKVARKEKVPDTTTVTQTLAMMRVLLFKYCVNNSYTASL